MISSRLLTVGVYKYEPRVLHNPTCLFYKMLLFLASARHSYLLHRIIFLLIGEDTLRSDDKVWILDRKINMNCQNIHRYANPLEVLYFRTCILEFIQCSTNYPLHNCHLAIFANRNPKIIKYYSFIIVCCLIFGLVFCKPAKIKYDDNSKMNKYKYAS